MQPNEYVDKFEKLSVTLLGTLNSRTRWFREMERLATSSPIDFKAIDRNGRDVAIEVKMRYCYVNTYEHIYLNPEKYRALMAANDEGFIPLYINFLQDGDHFLMWDLSKVTPDHVEEANVTNGATGNQHEHCLKYMLAVKEGMYFEYDVQSGRYKRRW